MEEEKKTSPAKSNYPPTKTTQAKYYQSPEVSRLENLINLWNIPWRILAYFGQVFEEKLFKILNLFFFFAFVPYSTVRIITHAGAAH